MTALEGTTVAFRNATEIINYMFKRAKEVKAEALLEYGYPVENPDELIKIYVGNIRGAVSKEVGVSDSASNDASVLLNAMRCFTLLVRGGPRVQSVYLLHYNPTVEQFLQFKERQGGLKARIMPSKWEQILQELADLRIRVKTLEDRMARLVDSV